MNTAVGLSLIYTAMYFGAGDIAANLIGYSAGLTISYIANSVWTFKTKPSKNNAIKYIIIMGLCYGINLATMLFSRDVLNFNSYVAQFLGNCAYTACGFVGARFYVFSRLK